MQEELAVLDFFSKPENLPLALSVAEQTDRIREQLNNRFWDELTLRVATLVRQHNLAWQVAVTEDRNATDMLVGFHCALDSEQPLYLRPMMEQQNLGKGLQIYFGLMWSSTPTPEQLALPAVQALRASLSDAGYKNNESFIAWQWTKLYPRSKSFLLRYTLQADTVFGDIESLLEKLLLNHGEQIAQANESLRSAPRSMTISLDQLRVKTKS
ncbi:MAG: hypothetical protein WCD45_08165 [Gallionella sp.]